MCWRAFYMRFLVFVDWTYTSERDYGSVRWFRIAFCVALTTEGFVNVHQTSDPATHGLTSVVENSACEQCLPAHHVPVLTMGINGRPPGAHFREVLLPLPPRSIYTTINVPRIRSCPNWVRTGRTVNQIGCKSQFKFAAFSKRKIVVAMLLSCMNGGSRFGSE